MKNFEQTMNDLIDRGSSVTGAEILGLHRLEALRAQWALGLSAVPPGEGDDVQA
jgi:hypothetical protein